jgi:tRNA G18 (ribose-2'-O)-methylase SpoU
MDFDFSLLSDLKDKDFSPLGLMALEGRFVIEKALEAKIDIVGLVRSNESDAAWLDSSVGRFPIHVMDHAELCRITGFRFHHGAIAIAKRPMLARFAASADGATNVGAGAFLCVWNVTDPSNVGALIRSAAGLGAAGVLLGPGCADPFYRKALRASMGTAFSTPLYSCDAEALTEAKAAGFGIWAATLSPEAIPLRECIPKKPFMLIVGNEGFGIPAEIVARCENEVYIPMSAGIDSLNVVVAAGICMFELFGNASARLNRR